MMANLIFCGLCQVTCTLVSAVEMAMSMMAANLTATYDFYPSGPTVLQTLSLIDNVSTLRNISYWLKYLGVIFQFNALCVLVYIFCKRHQYREVRALMGPSGGFFLLQLLGFLAQVVRLIILLLYTIKHACGEDKENLEPNYIMLGIAAVFGLLSLFLYIGYIFAYMYKKCVQNEDADRQRNKIHVTNTHPCETSVDIHLQAYVRTI